MILVYENDRRADAVALLFDDIVKIEKFNPYHGKDGRFASADGAASFTYAPGKSRAHDLAIQRQKEREANAVGGKPDDKPSGGNHAKQSKHLSQKEFFGDATTVEEASRVLADHLSKSSGKKISAKEADEMWDSVASYTGSSYQKIRASQRTGDGDAETIKAAKDIERYIELSPKWEGGPLYRGINVGKEAISRFKPGQKIDNGGTSSWTNNEGNAENFLRGDGSKVMLVMDKTKYGASVEHLSTIPGENEILVSQKSSMTVKSVQTKRGVTYVYVEES